MLKKIWLSMLIMLSGITLLNNAASSSTSSTQTSKTSSQKKKSTKKQKNPSKKNKHDRVLDKQFQEPIKIYYRNPNEKTDLFSSRVPFPPTPEPSASDDDPTDLHYYFKANT